MQIVNREIVNLNVNANEKSSVISQIKTTFVCLTPLLGFPTVSLQVILSK